jgi:hypothetical protein
MQWIYAHGCMQVAIDGTYMHSYISPNTDAPAHVCVPQVWRLVGRDPEDVEWRGHRYLGTEWCDLSYNSEWKMRGSHPRKVWIEHPGSPNMYSDAKGTWIPVAADDATLGEVVSPEKWSPSNESMDSNEVGGSRMEPQTEHECLPIWDVSAPTIINTTLSSLSKFAPEDRGSFLREYDSEFVPWATVACNANRTFKSLGDAVITRARTATSVLLARCCTDFFWEEPSLRWLGCADTFDQVIAAHPKYLKSIGNADSTIHQSMGCIRYVLEFSIVKYHGDEFCMHKMVNVMRDTGTAAKKHLDLQLCEQHAELPLRFPQYVQRVQTACERVYKGLVSNAHEREIGALALAQKSGRAIDQRTVRFGGNVDGEHLRPSDGAHDHSQLLLQGRDDNYVFVSWTKGRAIHAPINFGFSTLLHRITKNLQVGELVFPNGKGDMHSSSSWNAYFTNAALTHLGVSVSPKQVRMMCSTAADPTATSATVRKSLSKAMGLSVEVMDRNYSQKSLADQAALGMLWQQYSQDFRFDPATQNVTVPAFSSLGGLTWVPARILRTSSEEVTVGLFEQSTTDGRDHWSLGESRYVIGGSNRAVAWDRARPTLTTDPTTGEHRWRDQVACVEDARRSFDLLDSELATWAKQCLLAAYDSASCILPGDFVYFRSRSAVARVEAVREDNVTCQLGIEVDRTLATLPRSEAVAYDFEETNLRTVETTKRNLMFPVDVSFSKQTGNFIIKKSRVLNTL